MVEIKEGDVFEIEYPFTRAPTEEEVFGETETLINHNTGKVYDPWRPGTHYDEASHNYDEPPLICDGLGQMILTVVSVHRPGTFPTRVFYTRKWRSPSGAEFGKNKLRIHALGHFTRLRKGYWHEYTDQNGKVHGTWSYERALTPSLARLMGEAI